MKKILFSRWSTAIAFSWVAGLFIFSLPVSFFLSAHAGQMDFSRLLEAPSGAHLLGTDSLGRDLFSRLVVGTRVSMTVGFVAVGISVLTGLFMGAVAGYYGGRTDRFVSAFIDVMLCFPVLFLILAAASVSGTGLSALTLIIGLTSWMGTARLVRAEILSLKEREFVLALKALGAGDMRILFVHLAPNAMGPVIVSGVLGVSSAILLESGLSFLGIGVQPPVPSWGNILSEGKAVLGSGWWMTFFPGMMIFITVLAVNVLGEALRNSFTGKTR